MEPIEMNPLGLPSNSKNAKQQPINEAPKVPQVTVKTPWYRKFGNTMLAEDPTSVKSFIIRDIVVPTLKDTFFEILTEGLRMAMYGSARASRGSKKSVVSNSNSYVSYGSYSSNSTQRPSVVSSERMNYRDWVFDDYTKAREAFDYLLLRLETYRQVKVADYYDKVEITPPRAAAYYGWYDLSEMRISKVPGGWTLDLPRHVELQDRM